METTTIAPETTVNAPVDNTEAIENLLFELSLIPKGDRSLPKAKKIRRSLRKLGFFLSKIAKAESITQTA